MSNWIYKKQEFTDIPEGAIGFVYVIAINGCFYYGKKNFYSKRNVPKGKRELAAQDGRASKKKLVVTESNWRTYCSSSESIKALVLKGHEPYREILSICYSMKELSFKESKYIFNAIQDENNLNDNVQGKYFKEEINSWQKDTE